MDKKEYERMQETINDVCVKDNVLYRNYIFDNRFKPEDFVDDHMSGIGAEKLSNILNQDIITSAANIKEGDVVLDL